MYRVMQIHQQKTDHFYSYCEGFALLAKPLYNAALFRIRQIFTGWDKKARTDNEKQVFEEVALLKEAYPSIRVRRTISYGQLEKLMRVTENPDFFAGLPMQTAQQTVSQAVQDFDNWLKSMKEYRQHPEKFLGKPKMPGYKKSDTCTFTITNQDAVLYPAEGGSTLKFPLTKERLLLTNIPAGNLKEVKIKPHYGRYIISLTMEVEDVPKREDLPETAAVDFGTDNIAAIVCTDRSSAIYKGGAVLACNQWFAKQRAKYTGIITKGHEHMHASSARLTQLSWRHANFQLDQMHKVSRSIVDWCLEHGAGTLVLGVNKYWKQNANIGKANNQKFTGVPAALLRSLITYKANAAGITVLEQEESYTSKADVTEGDPIPVYGKDDKKASSFSGCRISRGLYRCASGLVINADCNGAANIMRKAFPGIWGKTTDFRFLADPEVFGFHELNPQSIPVERIAAA